MYASNLINHSNFFSLVSVTEAEYDLLTAIKIPFEDTKNLYIDLDGSDRFPALGFKPGSDVKIPTRLILPENLPPEFSILIRAKPRSSRGGYLFAVVNSYETVVHLGVKLTTIERGTNISLIYTDQSQVTSHIIANFTVSRLDNQITKIAFKVTEDEITLFINCNINETVHDIVRKPLRFDSASTLYIAQAGHVIDGAYEVSYALLFISLSSLLLLLLLLL